MPSISMPIFRILIHTKVVVIWHFWASSSLRIETPVFHKEEMQESYSF